MGGTCFIMKTIFLTLLSVFIISGCNNSADSKFSELQIKDKIIKVEIAKTDEEKKQGLSDRKDLCDNCGMLFIFENKAVRSFWMNRMNFQLDIIWVADGIIEKIK